METKMILKSENFEIFAAEVRMAGHLQYEGFEKFYYAIEKIGHEKAKSVINFLNDLVASQASDEDVMMMWFSTQTYTTLAPQIRQFTMRIVDMMENPRSPISPIEIE